MSSAENNPSHFVVVFRAPAAHFFERGVFLRARVPRRHGDVLVTFQSRHLDKGLEHPVPGNLWVDARGPATSLEEAVSVFGNVAGTITPVVAFVTNSAVGDLQLELAFDSTPSRREREFLQVFVPDERQLFSRTRRVHVDSVRAALAAIKHHPDKARINRAIAHYGLALKHWRWGDEILATAHLYMGIEALTKVVLRSKFPDRQLTKEEISARLGIDTAALGPCQRLSVEIDAAVRRQIIFRGDIESYKSAKASSDGLEHGFMPFDEIREKARAVRNKTAAYLREALLDVFEIESNLRTRISQAPYTEPLGHWSVTKYLRGSLFASRDSLASSENEYPIVKWQTTMKSVKINEKGEYDITFEDNLTPKLADGVTFQAHSFEVWAP